MLREQVENQTAVGKTAAPILQRGGYLPDDLMCSLIDDWLDQQKGGWVLDGFPRSIPQAEFLKNALAGRGGSLEAAVALDVRMEILLERIRSRRECPECRWSGQVLGLAPDGRCPACGAVAGVRADDDEENFRNRYREFTTNTLPLENWYESAGLLVHCNAEGPPDEVFVGLLKALNRQAV